MTVLHLDSSILGPHSVSRRLSGDTVARLVAAAPGTQVTYRDLAAAPVPHLSGATLMAAQGAAPDQAVAADLALGQELMREFKAADTLVIGVGFYNFSIPTQLKAWVDRIVIAGQTFRYDADGRPEGLAGDKRVILAIARGGLYGPGEPGAPFEHAETYLRAVFGFIGVRRIEVVFANGLAKGPAMRAAGVAQAHEQIAALAA